MSETSVSEEKITLCVRDESTVTIRTDEYRELLGKAVKLDTIAETIRTRIDEEDSEYSLVNDELVMLLTGTRDYLARKKAERRAAQEAMRKAAAEEDDGK